MDWEFIVIGVAYVACMMLLVRNYIVFKCRAKTILNWDFDVAPLSSMDDIYGSYEKMMFDITKWRYKDFFPDIQIKEKGD